MTEPLYWPCYGVEGDPDRWPPHAYILQADGTVPDEALPGTRPMDELLAMLKATHYAMDLREREIDEEC